MRSLLGATLRANPGWELVVLDRLSAAERDRLAAAAGSPTYGVLRPRRLGNTVKAVDCDTALLWLTLAQPGPCPAYVRETLGGRADRFVAALVADGVLEVETEQGFVSGPRALPGGEGAGLGAGKIAVLSQTALRLAAALPGEDPVALSRWLYRFNRTPKTPWWSRRETAGSVAGWLGLAAAGGTAVSAAVELEGGWLHFPRRAEAGPVPRYKLYVSPAARALPEVWGTIAAALAGAPVASFKLAATWDGLLRADRIVAHCADLADLAAAADRLAAGLAGVPAQGVPFTAEIAGDGLLSWGVDPPTEGQHTWRRWLTDRLAAALLAARAAGEAEPWRFAVERLRLDGVDPETWTPAADLWPEELRPSP